MIRWEQGRAVVEGMLEREELQRVTPDLDSATDLAAIARRHLESAGTIRETDPEGAYATLYDAARKACASLLEAQGLRATTRGGHIAVRDAVVAQFADLTGGSVLKAFDRLRRRRNDIEYPDSDAGIDIEEVDEALARAKDIVGFAEKLVDKLPVF